MCLIAIRICSRTDDNPSYGRTRFSSRQEGIMGMQQAKLVSVLAVALILPVSSGAQQLDSTTTDAGSPHAVSPVVDVTSGAISGSVPRLIKFSGVISSPITHAMHSTSGETG